MSISITEALEVARVVKEIKGGTIKRWVSEDSHEDIVIVDTDGNRYELKYYPIRNADESLD